MPKPAMFSESVQFGAFLYPSYRLFIIGFGFAIAGLLWWMQEGTRVGAMLRAGVDDEEIARALGINVSLLFTLVFALGAFLAALGGVMGGPIMACIREPISRSCCSASSSSSSADWEA